jgi:hypothetical protein
VILATWQFQQLVQETTVRENDGMACSEKVGGSPPFNFAIIDLVKAKLEADIVAIGHVITKMHGTVTGWPPPIKHTGAGPI